MSTSTVWVEDNGVVAYRAKSSLVHGANIQHLIRSSGRFAGHQEAHAKCFENSPDYVATERSVIRLLEEQNFSFTLRPLEDLKGFLICENGCRRVVVADDLSARQRIALYFHMIGHIASNHVDREKLSVIYEVRNRRVLPASLHLQEYQADIWVDGLFADLIDDAKVGIEPFQITLQQLRADYEAGWSWPHRSIHHAAPTLYRWVWPLKRLRAMPRVGPRLVPALYFFLDVLAQRLPPAPVVRRRSREEIARHLRSSDGAASQADHNSADTPA